MPKAKKPTRGKPGGARANAGRPRSELIKLRDDRDLQLAEMIASDIPEWYRTLRALAFGIPVERTKPDGTTSIEGWRVEPNFAAMKYMGDRYAGTPRSATPVDPNAVSIGEALALTAEKLAEHAARAKDDDGED